MNNNNEEMRLLTSADAQTQCRCKTEKAQKTLKGSHDAAKGKKVKVLFY